MIMKEGVPYHTFTAITQSRAIQRSPSRGTKAKPTAFSTQLNADEDESNSHCQPSVDSASGITQGVSNMPRTMRWLPPEMLCNRWARMKPSVAFRITAETAQK